LTEKKRPKLDIRYHLGDKIYKRVIDKILEIHRSRDHLYGDNWALMSLESLLYAAAYKIERARFTEDLDKQLDDLMDAANYIVFAINRLLDKKEERDDG